MYMLLFKLMGIVAIIFSSCASSTEYEEQYFKAKTYYNQHRYNESKLVLKELVNNPNAIYLYALTHHKISPHSSDYYNFLKLSAQLGNLWAIQTLIINNIGYKSDNLRLKYIELLESKIENGDGQAMALMANLYKSDIDTFISWTKKSARHSYAPAQFRLAQLYKGGDGFFFFESNRNKEILDLIKKSSDQGYHDAIRERAYYLLDSNKVEEGMVLLNNLVKKGDATTIFILASNYKNGSKNINKDLLQSHFYYSVYLKSISNEGHSAYVNIAKKNINEIIETQKKEDLIDSNKSASYYLEKHTVYYQTGFDEYEYTVDKSISSQLFN